MFENCIPIMLSYSKKTKSFENLRKSKLEKTQHRTLTILYDGMNNLYFNIMQILLFFWHTGDLQNPAFWINPLSYWHGS